MPLANSQLAPLEMPPKSKTEKRIGREVVRQRPVQKVIMKRGHKFAPVQFYQAVKCAVCNEFLMSGQGYQCICACFFSCWNYLDDGIAVLT
jgi:classical protein kinase C/novel protein kinase C epsilon type